MTWLNRVNGVPTLATASYWSGLRRNQKYWWQDQDFGIIKVITSPNLAYISRWEHGPETQDES
jgi:hypothetical protein